MRLYVSNKTWLSSVHLSTQKPKLQSQKIFDINVSVHRYYNFNYNQQDATILIDLFLKRSTCFRPFLRPSSGAHNWTHSFGFCQPTLLLAGIVALSQFLRWKWLKVSSISSTIPACSQFHLIHDTSLQQYWLTKSEAECTVMCSWWWAEEPPETCRAF